jgi:glycosyltransferase involved in cell wall biosynthesis
MVLLREMRFQVTFVPVDNYLYVEKYTAALQKIGVEVLYGPHINGLRSHLESSGERYDLVFIFRPGPAERYLESIEKYCPNAKKMYYPHDLHHQRMYREAKLINSERLFEEAGQMKLLELSVIDQMDASIMVTEIESELMKHELPSANIQHFPLVLNIPGTNNGFSERADIVFFGGYQHQPNVDAALYFVEQIMPIVREKLSGVNLHLVGSNPPRLIHELATRDVIVHGYIENLNSFLDSMRVAVAPLRYGAGIKGKIGTALAAGLPVVTTSIGAEGMLLSHGESAFIADDPIHFAECIAQIYGDESIWTRMSEEGVKYSDNLWGPKKSWQSFSAVLNSIGFRILEYPPYALPFFGTADTDA